MLRFISGASAVSDREHFKREISQIISRNKAATALAAEAAISSSAAPSAAPSPVAGSSAGSGSFNGLPSPSQVASQAGAAKDSPIAERDPTKDLAVRKKILMDNPDLYALHVDLVRGGAMSEEEFWEGREVRLASSCISCVF